mgnify:CR=1 FL=1
MAELTVDVVYSNALYSVAEDIGKKNEILEEGSVLDRKSVV